MSIEIVKEVHNPLLATTAVPYRIGIGTNLLGIAVDERISKVQQTAG